MPTLFRLLELVASRYIPILESTEGARILYSCSIDIGHILSDLIEAMRKAKTKVEEFHSSSARCPRLYFCSDNVVIGCIAGRQRDLCKLLGENVIDIEISKDKVTLIGVGKCKLIIPCPSGPICTNLDRRRSKERIDFIICSSWRPENV